MGIELDILPISSWLKDTTNPLLIAGPCSLETEEQAMNTAKQLVKDNRVSVFRGGVWKPRTRPGTFEGVGTVGLEWLKNIKAETGLPVGTEVANAAHTEEALKAGVDVIWIGARSTGSPFVVQEIADVLKGTDQVVCVKNPLTPDVQLWMGAFERLNHVGIKKLVGIHRGFTPFGESKYRNYPSWKTMIEFRRLFPEIPMICDPSHIAGDRDFIYEVAQKSFDMGVDGLMIESHINPECAWSDKDQQLTPDALSDVLDKLVIRYARSNNKEFDNRLNDLRDRIDTLDSELLENLSGRMELVKNIARYKKENSVTALQMDRWSSMMKDRVDLAQKLELDEFFVKILFQLIHEDSIRQQTEIMKDK